MRSLGFLLAIFWYCTSCNDPSIIGADLLDDQDLSVEYTEDIEIDVETVTVDSVVTFDPALAFNVRRYLAGRVADPLLGTSEASVFTGLLLKDASAPSFVGADLDSIVLVVVYDTTSAFVGDTTQFSTFEVWRMLELLNPSEVYYSNDDFFTGSAPIGVNDRVNPTRVADGPVFEIDPTTNLRDTIRYPAHLRIRLDPAFGEEIMDFPDSAFSNSAQLQDHINGIHIKPGADNHAILGLDLEHALSGLSLFYSVDSAQFRFDLSISNFGTTVNQFKHDYTGAPVADFINDIDLGDSLLFIQGMAGVNAKISFPDLEPFRDVVVNRAELELVVREEGSEFFPSMQFLVPNLVDSEGALTRFSPISGGQLIEDEIGGQILKKYSINIAGYFQDAILENSDNTLIFTAFPKEERAERSIIFGPGHSRFPLKLKLTYTLKPL